MVRLWHIQQRQQNRGLTKHFHQNSGGKSQKKSAKITKNRQKWSKIAKIGSKSTKNLKNLNDSYKNSTVSSNRHLLHSLLQILSAKNSQKSTKIHKKSTKIHKKSPKIPNFSSKLQNRSRLGPFSWWWICSSTGDSLSTPTQSYFHRLGLRQSTGRASRGFPSPKSALRSKIRPFMGCKYNSQYSTEYLASIHINFSSIHLH